ncbi:ATP-binding cassette domain-containing protein [Bacillus inaquosorum]|nr:ATP-binding cassette domain-containing protein [Bacillus inaquosorum]
MTFFVGENGSGKSTLLEAIADKCEFNTAGGSRNNVYELQESDGEVVQTVHKNISFQLEAAKGREEDAVLKSGKSFYGQADVAGSSYQTAYMPLKDQNGDIIGMLYMFSQTI